MKLLPIKHRVLTRQAAYYQLCRMMSASVRIGVWRERELYRCMQRPAVRFFAVVAADKYFHKGESSIHVKRHMRLMYRALLVMAPILQRIPRSLHLDQHRGHVLTWFRTYVGGNARRRFVSMQEVERCHDPEVLTARLKELGIRDRKFIGIMVALFRSYYWRDTQAGRLARILFDPIMIPVEKDRHLLRIGNRIYRLEKKAGRRTTNLNLAPFVVFDYQLRYNKSANQNKLLITLSESAKADFRKDIRGILAMKAAPENKAGRVFDAIKSFAERAKWAKDGAEDIRELRGWLWRKLQPLETQGVDVQHFPNVLVNLFAQKRKTEPIRARANVFYQLKDIDSETFMQFLSPYREI